eukprot:g34264.t1
MVVVGPQQGLLVPESGARHFPKALEGKNVFQAPQVTYLGYRVDKTSLHPLEDKVRTIKCAPAPTSVLDVMAFLGLVNYYEKFKMASILASNHKKK